jgi:hypothetical protein
VPKGSASYDKTSLDKEAKSSPMKNANYNKDSSALGVHGSTLGRLLLGKVFAGKKEGLVEKVDSISNWDDFKDFLKDLSPVSAKFKGKIRDFSESLPHSPCESPSPQKAPWANPKSARESAQQRADRLAALSNFAE